MLIKWFALKFGNADPVKFVFFLELCQGFQWAAPLALGHMATEQCSSWDASCSVRLPGFATSNCVHLGRLLASFIRPQIPHLVTILAAESCRGVDEAIHVKLLAQCLPTIWASKHSPLALCLLQSEQPDFSHWFDYQRGRLAAFYPSTFP